MGTNGAFYSYKNNMDFYETAKAAELAHAYENKRGSNNNFAFMAIIGLLFIFFDL
jgi:hypothetical protein